MNVQQMISDLRACAARTRKFGYHAGSLGSSHGPQCAVGTMLTVSEVGLTTSLFSQMPPAAAARYKAMRDAFAAEIDSQEIPQWNDGLVELTWNRACLTEEVASAFDRTADRLEQAERAKDAAAVASVVASLKTEETVSA